MTKLWLGLGLLIVGGAFFSALSFLWAKVFPETEAPKDVPEEEKTEVLRAVVHCTGGGAEFSKYNYQGIKDCLAASRLPGGGPLRCDYGCLGMGTCVKECPTGAIRVQNGVAVVDRERCTACGRCVEACPRHIISLEPFKPQKHVFVPCAFEAKGEAVTMLCTDGCISCSLCAKSCPQEAIAVEEGAARIDYGKCDHCGLCASKCSRHLIRVEKVAEPPKPEPPKPPREPRKPKPPKEKKPKEPKASKKAKHLRDPKWKLPSRPDREEKPEEETPSLPVREEKAPAVTEEKPAAVEAEVRTAPPVQEPAAIEEEAVSVKVEAPKTPEAAPAEEKPREGAWSSAEAFRAFEQAVAAAGEALGEKEEPAAEGTGDKEKDPAVTAADDGVKTE